MRLQTYLVNELASEYGKGITLWKYVGIILIISDLVKKVILGMC